MWTWLLERFLNRAMQAVQDKIEATLTRVVQKGDNPRVAARKLRNWLTPGTSPSADVPEDLLPGAAAAPVKVILRTETTKLLSRAKQRLAILRGEFVKWNLAASHPRLDICDPIAEDDQGWGAGVYLAGTNPSPPAHPNCRCYLSTVKPETIEEREAIEAAYGPLGSRLNPLKLFR